jgi:hypothetical protein
MTYQNEPWFALLQAACESNKRQKVAEMLGVSAPLVSQVLNGSGKYGTGEADTRKLGNRVIHTFGRYECPYLSEQQGEPTFINAPDCTVNAHRPPPAGSPRDMQFWQACNACKHKASSAPPVVREVIPRKGRSKPQEQATTPAAEPSTPTPTESRHASL